MCSIRKRAVFYLAFSTAVYRSRAIVVYAVILYGGDPFFDRHALAVQSFSSRQLCSEAAEKLLSAELGWKVLPARF